MSELPDPVLIDTEPVHGYLHRPAGESVGAVLLAHGAGGDCNAKVLVRVATALAEHGLVTLRFDLPFRRRRPSGPPHPSCADDDRRGIAAAATVLRDLVPGPLLIGGHSYGGRQSTMLAAEQPPLADGLVLLSYPLHPPKRPETLRTDHFPDLDIPAIFVHGDKDPFGTLDEMRAALALIPARTTLVTIERAGHDLAPDTSEVAALTAQAAAEQFFRPVEVTQSR